MSDIPLDEVVYFDALTHHPTTGAVTDADSTPTFEVFEEATDTDIGVGGNLTKRTSKTGDYRGSFTASAANGFEIGKWYNVIASATVNSIAGKANVMRFRVCASELSAGYPVVDLARILGTLLTETSGLIAAGFKKFFNVATPTGTVNSLPDAVAGASGGLLIAGTNAATTFTALTVTNATTLSGAVSFGSTFTVTGAITATNASNALTLGTFTVTTNAIAWNSSWDTEVQSEVDDALVVHRLDELLNADSDIDGAAPPTVGSVFHELMSKTAGSFTFDQTTDSCEAIRDRGDAAWTTATGFSTHSAADVWAVATRVLTAGTNIALAKGTGVTGFTDLSAADVRTAVGLGSANLDTQLGDLPTNAELATALGTADDATLAAIAALSIPTAAQNAAALMDLANGIETSITPRQALRLILAASAGKLSGAATTTIVVRNVGDSKDRITATVDASGNRSAVTTDAT